MFYRYWTGTNWAIEVVLLLRVPISLLSGPALGCWDGRFFAIFTWMGFFLGCMMELWVGTSMNAQSASAGKRTADMVRAVTAMRSSTSTYAERKLGLKLG